MISLDPSLKSEQYGYLELYIRNPFIEYYDVDEYPIDLRKQNRGRRWRIDMDLTFWDTDNDGAATPP